MSHEEFPVNPTGRFSGRAEVYRRYRSRYPREIIPLLREKCGLTPESIVADIGAGTGMLAELFLENGNVVYAIEPNADMRAACEDLTGQFSSLTCIDGTAEDTHLPNHSIDLIAVGRAFHWFDHEKCRPEFKRILRPDGWIVLAGLGPRRGKEPVQDEYQQILREHGIDYSRLRDRYNVKEAVRPFFKGGTLYQAEFPGFEELTYEGLEGHTISLSVTPQPNHPGFPAMQDALKKYFEKFERNGKLRLPTNCHVYMGQLG
ncbi:MAG: class I SAM-dependent methyltransferase [Acidobacteriota bacterium]|nr:class I SAM-dependent methyltransferase [Acidobacteriota bacterium]